MIKYCWTILIFTILFWSCKPEEEIIASNPSGVRFSADTMLFDTVFSTVGTITLRLKIYNDNSNAIRIGKISVGGGSTSAFKVIINGLETTSSSNVLLLGKDSLLVLVKVLIDPQNKNLPYLVYDSLVVSSGSNTQNVRLIAYGQDAIFLNNKHVSGTETWDSPKPYVVYGNLTIDTSATLTIKEGVRVFLGLKSAILVYGKISASGTFEKSVTFNSADLNKQAGVFPGQWAGIQLMNSSQENSFSWTVINNASTGLGIFKTEINPSADVKISHTQIKNMTDYAIYSQSGHINLDNSLFSNSGKNVIRIVSGGQGVWVNNTFVCYSFDFFRDGSTLFFSDNLNNSNLQNLSIQMTNNVVWGSFTNEITLSGNTTSGTFLISAERNVLKTNALIYWGTTNFVYDFASNKKLRNDTIHFEDPFTYNFRPDSISIVRNRAKVYAGFTDSNDLDGKPRDSQPDIGAYEYRKP